MEDVFNRLLVTSDPYIFSLRKVPQKKLKSLSWEAVELLCPPTMTTVEYENSSTIDTDSETDFDSDVDFDFDNNSDTD